MAIPHLQKAATRLMQARRTLGEQRPKPILSAHTILGLNGLASTQFFAGSGFFFTWLNPWALYAGDWCFIVGSFITLFVSICTAADQLREMRHFQAEADLARDDKTRDIAQQEYEEKHEELLESVSFVVSSLIFTAGCVLFYPHLFSDKRHQEWGEEIGAILFITGSFGFVLAAYWSSMAMVKKASIHDLPKVGSPEYRRRQITSMELLCSLIGSVLFVTGSFLYRPSYATDCSHEALRAAAKAPSVTSPTHLALLRLRSGHGFLGTAPPAEHALSDDFQGLCVNVMNQGTWLYVLGSTLFLAQCSLVAWRLSLPAEPQEHHGGHGETGAYGSTLAKASAA